MPLVQLCLGRFSIVQEGCQDKLIRQLSALDARTDVIAECCGLLGMAQDLVNRLAFIHVGKTVAHQFPKFVLTNVAVDLIQL